MGNEPTQADIDELGFLVKVKTALFCASADPDLDMARGLIDALAKQGLVIVQQARIAELTADLETVQERHAELNDRLHSYEKTERAAQVVQAVKTGAVRLPAFLFIQDEKSKEEAKDLVTLLDGLAQAFSDERSEFVEYRDRLKKVLKPDEAERGLSAIELAQVRQNQVVTLQAGIRAYRVGRSFMSGGDESALLAWEDNNGNSAGES